MDDEQGGILGAIGGGLAAIIRLLAALYGILTILFLLARITVGERLAIVAALNNVIPWLALGAAVLILPALGSRYRWLLIALQVPILAAFAVLYGPQFSRATRRPPLRMEPCAPPPTISIRWGPIPRRSSKSWPIDADIAGCRSSGPEHAQAIEQAFADDYEALVLHRSSLLTGASAC